MLIVIGGRRRGESAGEGGPAALCSSVRRHVPPHLSQWFKILSMSSVETAGDGGAVCSLKAEGLDARELVVATEIVV